MDFSIDPGGPESNLGGSRTNPGAEKSLKNEKNRNYKNYNFPPKNYNYNFPARHNHHHNGCGPPKRPILAIYWTGYIRPFKPII